MPRRLILPLLVLAAVFLHAPVRCQTPADTLALPDSSRLIVPESSATRAADFRPSRSPGIALLLSTVVPGAGQVYTGSYWKVPVIVGFGTYFLSQWLHYNRLTTEARDRYAASLLDGTGDQTQLALREFYKGQRDTYTWYMAILYLLNMADAYVDASLYDFDVGDDLTIRFLPAPDGRLTLQMKF
jgi:hypothetical protein